MEQNKVRSYFFYAVGEIMLVVIGILIALQINNWNEGINNNSEEAFYYNKLIENLRQDTTNLNISIERTDEGLSAIDQILLEFNTKNNEPLETDIARALITIQSYHPETATWENLKATGKINLIRRQVVIDSLTNYYNTYMIDTKQWLEANKEYSRNHLGPYLMKFDDIRLDFGEGDYKEMFRPQQKSVKEYRDDVFIRNSLIFKRTNLIGLRSRLIADHSRAVNTLNLINSR